MGTLSWRPYIVYRYYKKFHSSLNNLGEIIRGNERAKLPRPARPSYRFSADNGDMKLAEKIP